MAKEQSLGTLGRKVSLSFFSPKGNAKEVTPTKLRKGRSSSSILLPEIKEAVAETPLRCSTVEFLCEYLEKHGLQTEGIFRISGKANSIYLLRQLLALSDTITLSPDQPSISIHEVSGLLKAYLRERREPIVPFNLYQRFIDSQKTEDVNESQKMLKEVFEELPELRKKIFYRIICLLHRAMQFEEVSKMGKTNLAIVFGPGLMRPEVETMSIMYEMRYQCQVIELMLDSFSFFFPQGQEPIAIVDASPASGTIEKVNEAKTTLSQKKTNSQIIAIPRKSLTNSLQKKETEKKATEKKETEKNEPEDYEETDDPVIQIDSSDNAPETDNAEVAFDDQSFSDCIVHIRQGTEKHKWKSSKFSGFSPTLCVVCRKFISWNWIKAGYACSNCGIPVHAKCKDTAPNNCAKSTQVEIGQKAVAIGDKAPNFRLLNQRGEPVTLRQFLGQKVILFFYPKDFTPGCTIQNQAFRDNYSLLRYSNVEVLGVSADTAVCHATFTDRYYLPFTLLSDPLNKVRKRYGILGALGGLQPTRVTYVLNEAHTVVHIYKSLLKPNEHVLSSIIAVTQLLNYEVTHPFLLLPPSGEETDTDTDDVSFEQ